jgi:hypothetical protein
MAKANESNPQGVKKKNLSRQLHMVQSYQTTLSGWFHTQNHKPFLAHWYALTQRSRTKF